MIKILLFLSIFLTGCSMFDLAENKIGYIADSVTITWKRYDTRDEVEQACIDIGVVKGINETILACAQWSIMDKTCTMHALVPETLDDDITTTLGHETLHCFGGNFHQ